MAWLAEQAIQAGQYDNINPLLMQLEHEFNQLQVTWAEVDWDTFLN